MTVETSGFAFDISETCCPTQVPVIGPQNESAAVLCVVPLPQMQERSRRVLQLLQQQRQLVQIAEIRENVWAYLSRAQRAMAKLEWERAIDCLREGLTRRHDADQEWIAWTKLEDALG